MDFSAIANHVPLKSSTPINYASPKKKHKVLNKNKYIRDSYSYEEESLSVKDTESDIMSKENKDMEGCVWNNQLRVTVLGSSQEPVAETNDTVVHSHKKKKLHAIKCYSKPVKGNSIRADSSDMPLITQMYHNKESDKHNSFNRDIKDSNSRKESFEFKSIKQEQCQSSVSDVNSAIETELDAENKSPPTESIPMLQNHNRKGKYNKLTDKLGISDIPLINRIQYTETPLKSDESKILQIPFKKKKKKKKRCKNELESGFEIKYDDGNCAGDNYIDPLNEHLFTAELKNSSDPTDLTNNLGNSDIPLSKRLQMIENSNEHDIQGAMNKEHCLLTNQINDKHVEMSKIQNIPNLVGSAKYTKKVTKKRTKKQMPVQVSEAREIGMETGDQEDSSCQAQILENQPTISDKQLTCQQILDTEECGEYINTKVKKHKSQQFIDMKENGDFIKTKAKKKRLLAKIQGSAIKVGEEGNIGDKINNIQSFGKCKDEQSNAIAETAEQTPTKRPKKNIKNLDKDKNICKKVAFKKESQLNVNSNHRNKKITKNKVDEIEMQLHDKYMKKINNCNKSTSNTQLQQLHEDKLNAKETLQNNDLDSLRKQLLYEALQPFKHSSLSKPGKKSSAKNSTERINGKCDTHLKKIMPNSTQSEHLKQDQTKRNKVQISSLDILRKQLLTEALQSFQSSSKKLPKAIRNNLNTNPDYTTSTVDALRRSKSKLSLKLKNKKTKTPVSPHCLHNFTDNVTEASERQSNKLTRAQPSTTSINHKCCDQDKTSKVSVVDEQLLSDDHTKDISAGNSKRRKKTIIDDPGSLLKPKKIKTQTIEAMTYKLIRDRLRQLKSS